MRSFSRLLRRWHPVRLAVAGLAVMLLLILVAYAGAFIESGLTAGRVVGGQIVISGGVVAFAGLLAISVTAILYAWRPGAGARLE